ncbi:MAG: ABC transporter-like protein [bacterium]|nr:MAG: ABC transporter-like protein [bacterium]
MTPFLMICDADASLGSRMVLDGADVLVAKGQLVAVVGPNGAGKSSLIRAFAGLLPLTGGAVRLQGDDVSTLSARARRLEPARDRGGRPWRAVPCRR